jgi:hypothetical protein
LSPASRALILFKDHICGGTALINIYKPELSNLNSFERDIFQLVLPA